MRKISKLLNIADLTIKTILHYSSPLFNIILYVSIFEAHSHTSIYPRYDKGRSKAMPIGRDTSDCYVMSVFPSMTNFLCCPHSLYSLITLKLYLWKYEFFTKNSLAFLWMISLVISNFGSCNLRVKFLDSFFFCHLHYFETLLSARSENFILCCYFSFFSIYFFERQSGRKRW